MNKLWMLLPSVEEEGRFTRVIDDPTHQHNITVAKTENRRL